MEALQKAAKRRAEIKENSRKQQEKLLLGRLQALQSSTTKRQQAEGRRLENLMKPKKKKM